MKPIDLELPAKFGEWRPNQLEIAIKITGAIRSGSYSYLVDAPTGTGKSLIAAAVQKIMATNVRYLCTTKQLQDQLVADFPYAKTIKGRSNYVCLKFKKMFPEVTAEDCNHDESNPCKFVKQCPYQLAKSAALGAPLAVLNTSYFLHEANYVGAFSGCELLVLDEFDTVEDQLMNFVEVAVTKKQLDRLDIPPPTYKTKFESWVEWARLAEKQLFNQIAALSQELEKPWATVDIRQFRKLNAMKRLYGKLKFFIKEVDDSWVWYPGEDKWVFKPVWVAKYSDGVLWKHADSTLGMSATILDPRQVASNTGLWKKTNGMYKYIALPSPFPKENRPVYYEPCANIVNKTMSVALPKLAKAVDGILAKHPNEKILVHTVSYRVLDYLVSRLPRGRIMTHTAANREEVLDKFKASPYPSVLLSPSMDRGVDLPDEECRVVIIAKCPYPDISDPQVSRRVYGSRDGNTWYAHKTVSRIVQMAGRAVRSETDHAVTYILDEQFDKLRTEHKQMFPSWFLEAVVS